MITVFYDRKNHREVRSNELMGTKVVQSALAARDSGNKLISFSSDALERLEVIGELAYKSPECPAHVNWDLYLMSSDLIFLRLEDDPAPNAEAEVKVPNPEEMLEKLAKHYREPVLPLSRFCKAMKTWFSAIRQRNSIDPITDEGEPPWNGHGAAYAKFLGRIEVDIRKSNLLARLLHGGEPLRTEQCPKHKGVWHGGTGGCVYNCDGTGWLLTPELVEKRLNHLRAEYEMTDEQAVKEVELYIQMGALPDTKDPGFKEEAEAMLAARRAAGKSYSNPILRARDMLLWMGPAREGGPGP